MKKRQEEINFSKRSIDRPYYIDIEGERVWVNEEIYKIYKKDEDARKKKEEYQNRCNVIGVRGVKKCRRDCSKCEYFKHHKLNGENISVDLLKERYNIEISDDSVSILDRLIMEEKIEKINKEIDELNDIDQTIIVMLLQDFSVSEISRRMHKSRAFITKRKQMIQKLLMSKKIF